MSAGMFPWEKVAVEDDVAFCARLIDECFVVDSGEAIRRDIEAGEKPVIPPLKELAYDNKPVGLDAY
ncbi:hypothetical protein M440DRAFT_6173 [Trichoderma longibrachiatum ATCC 18648]|uniref:Uncharacterized protein n=1 Tax=Trichoderma longibrachiatum ATCC 18648 TaxID=983965 RepID=A0A2T4BZP7_TRILO|nr:hypothetical protein M440DRAFT_6173 [Trichoderma longibrachiatum ATCC 18648]